MGLHRTLFPTCRTNTPPNSLGTAAHKSLAIIASISTAGLVFASAGFGAVYAWGAGSQHGWLMAALMVLMAVALECCKPLAVASAFTAFRGLAVVRGVALTLLATVAIAYSLTAELTLMATARGDLVAERAAGAKIARSTDNQRARIEAELAKLADARPAAAIRAEVAGLLADPRAGDCSVMDGSRSKAACPRVAALRAELGNSERREKLEIDLAGLQAGLTLATDKAADPGAHALSVYLAALGVSLPDRLLTDWLTLVPVLALEIGAALALVLMQAVSGAQTGQRIPRQTELGRMSADKQKPDTLDQSPAVQPQTALPDTQGLGNTSVPVSGPSSVPAKKRTPRKPKKRRRLRRTRGKGGNGSGGGQSGKRRLGNVVDLLKARGGRIDGGQRAIAKTLGLSKSRVNEVLHELAAAGAVRLATSRSGTMVTLPAALDLSQ
jgi:hypothetical protein